jgi:hypothetical protein
MAKKRSSGISAKSASQTPRARSKTARATVTGGPSEDRSGSGPELQVVVTLQESAADRIDEVARKLRSAGMIVDQKLALLGQCVGRTPAALLEKLRKVSGVDAVETAGDFQLPDDPHAPQ